MKITADIAKKIEQWGSNGYSTFRIAKELNMSIAELRDERAKNPALNTALERAEYCYEQFRIDEYEQRSFNVKSPIQADDYKRLQEKHSSNNDNKIEIEFV